MKTTRQKRPDRVICKLRWTDYDIKNPSKATSEWLEVHKGADEIICDRNGNPSYVIYKSPISMAHQMMKESLEINKESNDQI